MDREKILPMIKSIKVDAQKGQLIPNLDHPLVHDPMDHILAPAGRQHPCRGAQPPLLVLEQMQDFGPT